MSCLSSRDSKFNGSQVRRSNSRQLLLTQPAGRLDLLVKRLEGMMDLTIHDVRMWWHQKRSDIPDDEAINFLFGEVARLDTEVERLRAADEGVARAIELISGVDAECNRKLNDLRAQLATERERGREEMRERAVGEVISWSPICGKAALVSSLSALPTKEEK